MAFNVWRTIYPREQLAGAVAMAPAE
jgi:hypothetical protein